MNLIFLILSLILPNVILQEDEANEIVVKLLGGPVKAKRLAEETGHWYKGMMPGFDDTYIFIPLDQTYPNYQKRGGFDIEKHLLHEDNGVIWAEKQYPKSRQKRDFLPFANNIEYYPEFTRNKDRFREIYKKPIHPNTDSTFNDELWSQEWYMQDTRARYDLPKLDLNVLPVYKSGITGRNIRISILDDGIEYTHDDLKDNYDPLISYDCNEEDEDPMPRYDPKRYNSHGTRCAGEIAMAANNGKCGVGIAYNSRIGGVKLLDGPVTDRIEATALSYAQDYVDIYSASWGPNDNGQTVDGPGRLALEAIQKGILHGRKGRGTIYVWASGNGGSKDDNCNCDGYLTNPFTISIGSASQKGEFPWYGEVCASTLAVTYSSGAYKDQMIATTDLHNECTIKHTGTSASAPLAAGIIALALEANPDLTWRDVQHLIVWTSEIAPLQENPGWQRNAAGFWFNTKFGFGLMNAYGLVKAAMNWTTVPKRHTCQIPVPTTLFNQTLVYNQPLTIQIITDHACNDHIDYLEHVELTITIQYPIRGVLEVYLMSPLGSRVELLGKRKYDKSKDGFHNWTFMSVMTWGETAAGIWTLTILDQIGPQGNQGYVNDIVLTLHGSVELPEYIKYGPRIYNHYYNRLHDQYENLLYSSPIDQIENTK